MTEVQWWMFPMKPVRVTDSVFKTSVNERDFVMEKKFDGWRGLLIVGTTPTLWTRDKKRIDIPDNLTEQLSQLNLPAGTVLDGEIWNPLKRGSWRHNKQVACKLTFWDAIRHGTEDLSLLSVEERTLRLSGLVGAGTDDIRAVEQIPATLENLQQVQKEAEDAWAKDHLRSGFIHGVVIKRRGSPRRDHATRCVEHADWLKIVFQGAG